LPGGVKLGFVGTGVLGAVVFGLEGTGASGAVKPGLAGTGVLGAVVFGLEGTGAPGAMEPVFDGGAEAAPPAAAPPPGAAFVSLANMRAAMPTATVIFLYGLQLIFTSRLIVKASLSERGIRTMG
jgi:hypothetical protein